MSATLSFPHTSHTLCGEQPHYLWCVTTIGPQYLVEKFLTESTRGVSVGIRFTHTLTV